MADEEAPSGRLPFEIYVGVDPPAHWSESEATAAAREGHAWDRPDLAQETFPWERLGVLPRFVGSETATCVAAVQPSIFNGHGADEFTRFLAAASRRGETALIVSMVGGGDPDRQVRNVFSRSDTLIPLPGLIGYISGRRLPEGAAAEVADQASGVDRDLALRLRNRPPSAPWWAIQLAPTVHAGEFGHQKHQPGGRIEPLLVNSLGEILAGVWIPDSDRSWRWYVLPGGTDWEDVIVWLAERAIPEHVPDAARRARSAELVDDELLTADELDARDQLARLEQDIERRRNALLQVQEAAHRAAEPIRSGLLYGTGALLVGAVREVLAAAGFDVEDLDATFGTRSADLLASKGGRSWLVEVKSATGSPGERLLADLDRHVRTWPQLGRPEELAGSVLVINHQHNLAPLDRAAQPFTRPEFLASLTHSVVPALALFAWWRDHDHELIIDAVTGATRCHKVDLARHVSPGLVADDLAASTAKVDQPSRRRRWWRRRELSA